MTDADELLKKTEVLRVADRDLPADCDLEMLPKWILPSAEAIESASASTAERERPLQHAYHRSSHNALGMQGEVARYGAHAGRHVCSAA